MRNTISNGDIIQYESQKSGDDFTQNENDQLKNSIDLCKNSDFADNDECHTDYNKQCFSPAYFKIRRLNDPHLSIIQIDRNAIPKKIQKGFSQRKCPIKSYDILFKYIIIHCKS